MLKRFVDRIELDWYLFAPALLVSLSGLVTMNSFEGDNYFFLRQSIWILLSIVIFLVASSIDWRFLRRTSILVPLYFAIVLLLLLLLAIG